MNLFTLVIRYILFFIGTATILYLFHLYGPFQSTNKIRMLISLAVLIWLLILDILQVTVLLKATNYVCGCKSIDDMI